MKPAPSRKVTANQPSTPPLLPLNIFSMAKPKVILENNSSAVSASTKFSSKMS
ncbi:hypothetical protein D3C79_1073240 [compost metagenome]